MHPWCNTRSERHNQLPSQMSRSRSWHSRVPLALELVLCVGTSPSPLHACCGHTAGESFASDEQHCSNEANRTHQPGRVPPLSTVHKHRGFGSSGIISPRPFSSVVSGSRFLSILQCRRTRQLPGLRWLRGAGLSPAASALLDASNLLPGSAGWKSMAELREGGEDLLPRHAVPALAAP